MPAPPRPADSKLYGRTNHFLFPAIADLLSPKLAEVTAPSVLDVTNIYFQDGTTWPEQETATVELPRRGGDTVQFQGIGDTTYGAGTLIYAVGPQAETGSDSKKLLEAIPAGTQKVLGYRQAVPAETALQTGQFLHLMLIEFGPSAPTSVGEGASAVSAARATFVVRSYPAFWRPIAAS